MPGTKWLANQNPENDWSSISKLISALKGVSTRRFVLASTVDVYPTPNNVDETTTIDPDNCHPYGLHRLKIEQFVSDQFPEVTVVRLPALFGDGLKKNAIFDLMHSHRLDALHPDSRFQFYFLDRLWSDITKALDHHLQLVNFASEPVRLGDIADTLFSIKLKTPANPAADYNFTSIHAATFGGNLGYLLSSDQVISDLKTFIHQS